MARVILGNTMPDIGNINNQISQRIQNTGFAKRDRVILFFTSPRLVPNQFRRTHQFEFDEKYRHQFADAVQSRIYNETLGLQKIASLVGNPGNQSVRPSQDGMPVNLSVMSDFWTFCLLHDTVHSAGGMSQGMNSYVRHIYMGICLTEPGIPNTLNTVAPKLNPNCILEFTHHTVLTSQTEFGQYGKRINHGKPIDTEIINQITVQQVAPPNTPLFYNDPINLNHTFIGTTSFERTFENHDGINFTAAYRGEATGPKVVLGGPTYSGEYNEFVDSMHGGSINDPGIGDNVTAAFSLNEASVTKVVPGMNNHQIIDATLNSPKIHAATIANNLSAAVAKEATNKHAGVSFYSDLSFEGYQNVESGYADNIRNDHNRLISIGRQFDLTRGIDIKTLLAKFNNDIKIVSIEVPNASQWDTANQMANTRTNMLSSIIESSIGPVCTNMLISEVSFVYVSTVPSQSINVTNRGGAWQIDNIRFMVEIENDQVINQRIEEFKRYVQENIFNILLHDAGDFRLICHYNRTGETLIWLHFLDDIAPEAWNEYNNFYSALTTPIIGNKRVTQHNSQEMSNLILNVS